MKELLSIEEKAQRYDLSLKAALTAYKDEDRHLKATLERIFPELRESEDDKIKKWLISQLKIKSDGTNSELDIMIDKAISWLEKQGEQILANSAKTCKDEQKPADFSDLRTWKYIVDAVWTEKEGIGQYLDSQFTEEVAKKLQKRFGNIEQKPWSEEDELHIRELESLVKRIWAVAEHENDKETIHKMSDLSFFLKTYKPHPKQEWSEEDERNLNDAILFIETGTYSLDKDNLINWLKSLRPQSTWKPSDEQMKALDEVYKTHGANNVCRRVLFNLMNDLKQLKQQEL